MQDEAFQIEYCCFGHLTFEGFPSFPRTQTWRLQETYDTRNICAGTIPEIQSIEGIVSKYG